MVAMPLPLTAVVHCLIMTSHHPPRRSRQTFCRICEAACGLLADLDASGQPIRLRPDRQHPTSQGFACAKGTRFLDVATHPERLLTPLHRGADGRYEPIAWATAMSLLGDRLRPLLQRYGPHAIGVYFGNPLAFNTLGMLTMLGFLQALGTRNVFSAGSQDCANKFAGAQIVHGSPLIHPLPDFEQTDVAVLLGTNPAVSQGSFVHLAGGSLVFDRLRQRGVPMFWIDPRRTESAQRWGEHFAIRPGTDIFLLLTLLDALRDRYRPDPRAAGLETLLDLATAYPIARAAGLTGLTPAQITRLATTLHTARRATLHMSVGVNQGAFGTLCYVALHALAYLTGHLDRAGGLLFHPLAVSLAAVTQRLGLDASPTRSRVGAWPSVLHSLPAGILADEILTPGSERIRALLVVAGDPLTSIPGEARLRQAFRHLDYLVCVDMFQNATSTEAHLLLPSTSWLERWDLANTTALLQHTSLLQYAHPVSAPPGGARSEARILAEISLALGQPFGGSRTLTHLWRWLARDTTLATLSTALLWPMRWLSQGNYGVPVPRPQPGRYLGRGPRTPGHRIRFWHADLATEPARLAAYAARFEMPSRPVPSQAALTLALICRRRRLGHNSWLHGAGHDGMPERLAWLAPEDLSILGIPAGGTVLLSAGSAALQVQAVPTSGVSQGTIVVPHGVPGLNVNALIPSGAAHLEPLSGQHDMTGMTVQVAALG